MITMVFLGSLHCTTAVDSSHHQICLIPHRWNIKYNYCYILFSVVITNLKLYPEIVSSKNWLA
jgi:hypothetical protein